MSIAAPVAFKMEGPVDREECVYMAKLAEQAERYDEMVRTGLLMRVGSWDLPASDAHRT